MDQAGGTDLFISAVLEEISPGEYLLFANGIAVPGRSDALETGEKTALGFGPADAAQWVAPCVAAVAAWLWSAAEAPLKDRVSRYLNSRLSTAKREEPTLRSPLIEVADEFKNICTRSGFDEAESERLRSAFIASFVQNPKIMQAMNS